MVFPQGRDTSWRPLLTGVQADLVSPVVAAAALDLAMDVVAGDAFDLATGAIGAALLLNELERSGLASDLHSCDAMPQLASARLHVGATTRGLWQGAAGFDWARTK